MKTKALLTLLAGAMASSMAMAVTTSTPDYTLATSDNLIDQYEFSDSGYFQYTDSAWLSSTPTTYTTAATVLGTYQNDGQWYQTTQFVTTASYQYTFQEFTETRRNINFHTSDGPVADAFVDLSFNVGSSMNYSVSAGGTSGVTTSPRGYITLQSPTLGLRVDSIDIIAQQYAYPNSDRASSWYASNYGSVDGSFQAAIEAPGSSALSYLSVSLTGDRVNGALFTQTYTDTTQQWTENVLISAPVPEPETYAMMLAGLGLMGAVVRRRKQNQA